MTMMMVSHRKIKKNNLAIYGMPRFWTDKFIYKYLSISMDNNGRYIYYISMANDGYTILLQCFDWASTCSVFPSLHKKWKHVTQCSFPHSTYFIYFRIHKHINIPSSCIGDRGHLIDPKNSQGDK